MSHPSPARFVGLNDNDLAFFDELFKFLRTVETTQGTGVEHPPGWSNFWVNRLCQDVTDECTKRGISNGGKIRTEVLDLRK